MPLLRLRLERIPTSIGVLISLTDEQDFLRVLEWEECESRLPRVLRLHYGANGTEVSETREPSRVRQQLEAYFAGELSAIDSIHVETGGTPFQREVWSALRRIPAGRTTTYGELATQINRPAAVRAVGLANGSNPIPIVVPCHRVIGADTSLTGYGGGLHRKQWLLVHEGALLI